MALIKLNREQKVFGAEAVTGWKQHTHITEDDGNFFRADRVHVSFLRNNII